MIERISANMHLSSNVPIGRENVTSMAVANTSDRDSAVRELLVNRSIPALRVATWILGDPWAAEEAV
jgi:hypothetical protein